MHTKSVLLANVIGSMSVMSYYLEGKLFAINYGTTILNLFSHKRKGHE